MKYTQKCQKIVFLHDGHRLDSINWSSQLIATAPMLIVNKRDTIRGGKKLYPLL